MSRLCAQLSAVAAFYAFTGMPLDDSRREALLETCSLEVPVLARGGPVLGSVLGAGREKDTRG